MGTGCSCKAFVEDDQVKASRSEVANSFKVASKKKHLLPEEDQRKTTHEEKANPSTAKVQSRKRHPFSSLMKRLQSKHRKSFKHSERMAAEGHDDAGPSRRAAVQDFYEEDNPYNQEDQASVRSLKSEEGIVFSEDGQTKNSQEGKSASSTAKVQLKKEPSVSVMMNNTHLKHDNSPSAAADHQEPETTYRTCRVSFEVEDRQACQEQEAETSMVKVQSRKQRALFALRKRLQFLQRRLPNRVESTDDSTTPSDQVSMEPEYRRSFREQEAETSIVKVQSRKRRSLSDLRKSQHFVPRNLQTTVDSSDDYESTTTSDQVITEPEDRQTFQEQEAETSIVKVPSRKRRVNFDLRKSQPFVPRNLQTTVDSPDEYDSTTTTDQVSTEPEDRQDSQEPEAWTAMVKVQSRKQRALFSMMKGLHLLPRHSSTPSAFHNENTSTITSDQVSREPADREDFQEQEAWTSMVKVPSRKRRVISTLMKALGFQQRNWPHIGARSTIVPINEADISSTTMEDSEDEAMVSQPIVSPTVREPPEDLASVLSLTSEDEDASETPESERDLVAPPAPRFAWGDGKDTNM